MRTPSRPGQQTLPACLWTQLRAGLVALELLPDEAIIERYLRFLDLLLKWNRVNSLVAGHDPEQILRRHMLDSLSIHPYVRGQRCLDVGSGAGFPGLMLAMAQPERHWYLLDSRTKKWTFLRQVAAELDLDNVTVVASRVEDYRPQQAFHTLSCRGVAPLSRLLRLLGHLLTPATQLLAMCGRGVDAELAAGIDPGLQVVQRWQLDTAANSHLLCITRRAVVSESEQTAF